MVSGYYIVPIDIFHAAANAEPFQACAHQIDETHVICWARFPDQGHEARFLAREGVEHLPDIRDGAAIAEHHASRLAKYGIENGHTTLNVCERLVKVAGHCMKLPGF